MGKRNSMPKIVCRFDRSASVLNMMTWFAREGIRVFPVHGIAEGECACGTVKCKDIGKHPIGWLVPHGVKDATTDIKTIRKWHKQHPAMNYGVATEGLAVIDCDSKEPQQHPGVAR